MNLNLVISQQAGGVNQDIIHVCRTEFVQVIAKDLVYIPLKSNRGSG